MPKPLATDYAPFYQTYVALTSADTAQAALSAAHEAVAHWIASIPEAKADYAYAPGKWTVKQVIQHLIDTERIFAYRALCVARGEQQSLPGFDENAYAAIADVSERSLFDLKAEIIAVNATSRQLFQFFTEAVLQRSGAASANSITVNAIGFIMAGHLLHHLKIYAERYAN